MVSATPWCARSHPHTGTSSTRLVLREPSPQTGPPKHRAELPKTLSSVKSAAYKTGCEISGLVPRRSTRIVLCDDDDGLAERAAKLLSAAGYTDIACLAGGVQAWADAGYELFSGVNVPSKAFGEYIEHECGTPSIGADELHAMMRGGADMVVLDSRPLDEFRRVSVPTATNVPGAELVLRVHDLAPSAATTVVANCAGRT